jgi:hypothetical protein
LNKEQEIVMSTNSSPPTRRSVLKIAAAGIAADNAIHRFRIDIPEAALVDLRQRINATRWPERETVLAARRVHLI